MYSKKINNYMVFVGQVSRLVKNFNIAIFSGTMNLINVKVCMTVLLTELYLFVALSQFQ